MPRKPSRNAKGQFAKPKHRKPPTRRSLFAPGIRVRK